MKKIATLLLLCMAMALFIPATVLAEEQKMIPEDVEVITFYRGDIETYFDVVETMGRKDIVVDKEISYYNSGDKYTVYSEELATKEYVVHSDGTVGLGENYMGYTCVHRSSGPPKLYTYAGLYDEGANVFYYFPKHTFKIVGNEMYIQGNLDYDAGPVRTYYIAEFKAVPKKAATITVTHNGEKINFDQKPVAENGRTLVPLRAIFEKLGATVAWDGNTQTVTATKGDVVITLTLNNTTATKNGQPVILDVPAKAINGRTLVPVRFIADCFGVTTGWDQNAQRVILTD